MDSNMYIAKLNSLMTHNIMTDYEDMYSDFIFTYYSLVSGQKLKIVVRGDYVNAELLWHIRYIKSKNVNPIYCLTIEENVKKYKEIMGIPMITISELKDMDTSNMMLLVVNRKSDFTNITDDYREDCYFKIRQRAKIGFYRERGAENFFALYMNKNRYYHTLQILEDEESKICFCEILRCLIENDVYREHEYLSCDKYFESGLYNFSMGETWINCGAATGDTILQGVYRGIDINRIIAVEVNDSSIEKLKELKEILTTYTNYDMRIIQKYLAEGENSIDLVFQSEDISLINMDVEGAELGILKSAKDTIVNKKPVLAICAYHNPDDLIEIPDYISSISSDYHFFLRKYKGYSPDAVNEYVYYAVPTDRLAGKI